MGSCFRLPPLKCSTFVFCTLMVSLFVVHQSDKSGRASWSVLWVVSCDLFAV